ncbi:MAG: UDP-N-acetylmuramoyl-tripeptide--D-alanyl-D-alanine ligase, partial [Microgenomates group bacterium LiPW_16]
MTMKPVKSTLASTLINDTFNANPAGVLAAIEYAKVYKGKKILVLQPMIELGSAAEQAHREVGMVAVKICDLVILTNKNFNKPFLEGAGKEKGEVLILDPKTSAERIKNMVDNESVVVFEGKESARVLAYFT